MKDNMELFFEKTKEIRDIDANLYKKYAVKNGLRNEDGTGVLVGLTKISDVVGYCRECEQKVDVPGELYYRGINIRDIVKHRKNRKADLYEEVCFLILFGYLPNKEELSKFQKELHKMYHLPQDFLENKVLRSPTKNLMNKMQQDVLMLYAYDKNPDDVSVNHILHQGLHIVAKLPALVCYEYQSKVHYFDNDSMFIHPVDESKSIAESILSMLRPDKKYSEMEASVLDIALLLHADHGGGNNSTFVNVVMSSSGTDIYSSFAGAIGSLKGPKHGGANLKVGDMMDAVLAEIDYSEDETALRAIINKIMDKQFYDKSGLVYGMGHAVYTLSDPRSEILKEAATKLAKEKGMEKQFNFFTRFEKVASEVIYERKGIRCSANVDFYSGFVYEMLGIPKDMYTLLFVCARSIGWLAHNIESQLYSGKIVRPATKYVGELETYVALEERG